MITLLEVMAVIAICIGFWHESKVIELENKIASRIRKRITKKAHGANEVDNI